MDYTVTQTISPAQLLAEQDRLDKLLKVQSKLNLDYEVANAQGVAQVQEMKPKDRDPIEAAYDKQYQEQLIKTNARTILMDTEADKLPVILDDYQVYNANRLWGQILMYPSITTRDRRKYKATEFKIDLENFLADSSLGDILNPGEGFSDEKLPTGYEVDHDDDGPSGRKGEWTIPVKRQLLNVMISYVMNVLKPYAKNAMMAYNVATKLSKAQLHMVIVADLVFKIELEGYKQGNDALEENDLYLYVIDFFKRNFNLKGACQANKLKFNIRSGTPRKRDSIDVYPNMKITKTPQGKKVGYYIRNVFYKGNTITRNVYDTELPADKKALYKQKLSTEYIPTKVEPPRDSGAGLHRWSNRKRVYAVGKGLAYQPKVTWHEWGKYVIHKPSLAERTLSIRYPSLSSITDLPRQPISKVLADTIDDMLVGGRVNPHMAKLLQPDDLRLLRLICKKGEVGDVGLGMDEEGEQEMDRFELLRSEVVAGQNSPQSLKELKQYILKFMSDGRLKKSEGHGLLAELAILT